MFVFYWVACSIELLHFTRFCLVLLGFAFFDLLALICSWIRFLLGITFIGSHFTFSSFYFLNLPICLASRVASKSDASLESLHWRVFG